MSLHEYDPAVSQAARRLFGFAISHDPSELYRECGNPRASRMANHVAGAITEMYLQQQNRSAAVEPERTASRLLFYGIDDVQTLIDPFLRTMSPDAGHEFVTSDEACQWLATLALRPHDCELDGFSTLVNVRHPNYRFVTSTASIGRPELRVLSPDAKRGCPFAGSDGEVNIDPQFRRFVPWAGSLVLAAIDTHHLRSTLPLATAQK